MSIISDIFGKKTDWIKEINKDLHEEIEFLKELEESSKAKIKLATDFLKKWGSKGTLKELQKYMESVKHLAEKGEDIIGRFQKRIREQEADLLQAIHLAKVQITEKEEVKIEGELKKLEQILDLEKDSLRKQLDFFKDTSENLWEERHKINELFQLFHDEAKILETISENIDEFRSLARQKLAGIDEETTDFICRLVPLHGLHHFFQYGEDKEIEGFHMRYKKGKGRINKVLDISKGGWTVATHAHHYDEGFWKEFFRHKHSTVYFFLDLFIKNLLHKNIDTGVFSKAERQDWIIGFIKNPSRVFKRASRNNSKPLETFGKYGEILYDLYEKSKQEYEEYLFKNPKIILRAILFELRKRILGTSRFNTYQYDKNIEKSFLKIESQSLEVLTNESKLNRMIEEFDPKKVIYFLYGLKSIFLRVAEVEFIKEYDWPSYELLMVFDRSKCSIKKGYLEEEHVYFKAPKDSLICVKILDISSKSVAEYAFCSEDLAKEFVKNLYDFFSFIAREILDEYNCKIPIFKP